MIPLSYFLIAWVILLVIFGVLMLLTLVQMLRHGLASPSTYISTFMFLVVTAGVLLWTLMYFTSVDWNTSINVLPEGIETLFGVPASSDSL